MLRRGDRQPYASGLCGAKKRPENWAPSSNACDLFHVQDSRETPRPYRRRQPRPPEGTRCACTRPCAPGRDKCSGCSVRSSRGHLVTGPCAACGQDDQRVLRRHTLAGGPVVLCANDSAIAGRRLLTLDELRSELRPLEAGRRTGRDRRARAARRRLPGLGGRRLSGLVGRRAGGLTGRAEVDRRRVATSAGGPLPLDRRARGALGHMPPRACPRAARSRRRPFRSARACGSLILAIGLVAIPLKLYPAISPQEVGFHQVHDAPCKSRLEKRRMACPVQVTVPANRSRRATRSPASSSPSPRPARAARGPRGEPPRHDPRVRARRLGRPSSSVDPTSSAPTRARRATGSSPRPAPTDANRGDLPPHHGRQDPPRALPRIRRRSPASPPALRRRGALVRGRGPPRRDDVLHAEEELADMLIAQLSVKAFDSEPVQRRVPVPRRGRRAEKLAGRPLPRARRQRRQRARPVSGVEKERARVVH